MVNQEDVTEILEAQLIVFGKVLENMDEDDPNHPFAELLYRMVQKDILMSMGYLK